MTSTHSTFRVRILGGLDVERGDSSHVSVDEWRTGKTMDLLRLLALANGRPVRPASLIDKLWPDVTAERGRGSLRTASSRIRRVVGHNCVHRQPDGLVLTGAWVDAEDLVTQARRVHAAARDLDHLRVLDLARDATPLYRGDFRAHDDDSGWARAERESLAQRQHDMLCEAAAAALALRLFGEGHDFAAAAVGIDRTSETAHRALMHALAELGEIGSALRVFESYRARLADELGADPSPQTRELHLRLLRGTA